MKVRYQGEDLFLKEGQELSLPEETAYRLLAKAGGNIILARGLSPKADRWVLSWKALAALTYGFDKSDPRHDPVFSWLKECDRYFEQDDWEGFQATVTKIRGLILGETQGKV